MSLFDLVLVQPLLNILFGIYALIPGHDFGVAVIILTVLVRLALWPLVTKQLHSQRAMQKMAPEIAKVKEKAAGDRQKETEMLMELYKEKGTSPFAPLLPLLIQLPIFIALYSVLRHSVDVAAIAKYCYGFVAHLSAVADVIGHKINFSPSLFGLIDLTKSSPVLAVTAAGAQFFQTRQLQPKNQPMDDQAKMMSGMTYVFPIITALVALSLPSALALYWTFTSVVAIYQQRVVLLRDAHEMEEVKGGKK
ncbi:MAG TPA: YidC/Oxa1 family membrane protein insertase [Candidatus Saccharimonadales bacterium]|nr:YidC/Oxa1 family membrane protein insertase [Candidatus Saccharimonadales bacterium]